MKRTIQQAAMVKAVQAIQGTLIELTARFPAMVDEVESLGDLRDSLKDLMEVATLDPRPYFTLLARDKKDEPWTAQFGDFDKAVVQEERKDMNYSGAFNYFKIIQTSALQRFIDQEIARINAADLAK